MRLSSTYFAGAATDGRAVEIHSKIKAVDINTLMRLLDRMTLKLHEIYNDHLEESATNH